MLKNYLKIAVRNLLRQKIYFFINASGLALGMACSFLIFLYVQDELSYDKFHQDPNRIFRLVELIAQNGKVMEESASAPFPIAPALKNDYPEIAIARLFRLHQQKPLISHGDKKFYEERFFFADSTVFEVLTFPLLKGNPREVLREPFSVVLTENTARKYFGDEEPLGKSLVLENKFQFEVTGVLKNIPVNSHIQFDFLASFAGEEYVLPGYGYGENWLKNWYWNPCFTYLRLPPNLAEEEFERLLPAFTDKYYPDSFKGMISHYLQPVVDIHLQSHIDNELQPNSNGLYVYVFSVVAIFILLIACINYMNLATARSASRAREIGIRKVAGSHRRQLVMQFLGESILISVFALLIAVGLMELFLPAFNMLSGKAITLASHADGLTVLSWLGVALLVGIVAGSYPAFYLSRFRPTQMLKGQFKSSTAGIFLRRTLVVLQFAISTILIAGTAVVNDQLNYIRKKDLGFNKDQVVVLPMRGTDLRQRYEAFKNELLHGPNVVNVTATSDLFGKSGGTLVKPFRAEGLPEKEFLNWPGFAVDYNFLQAMDMKIAAGRSFSKEFSTDATEAYILNEAAAKMLEWKNPLGKQFSGRQQKGVVIGVVKDFNLFSLHRAIEPAALFIRPDWYDYVLVRITPDNVQASLDFLQAQWQEFSPERPFEYSFLDENFEILYNSEKSLGRLFSYFTGLAIFIACLGLLGLASFSAEQRTKEIGIRKVLGASVTSVLALLSKDFVKLVLVANLIAWPLAWYAMNRWLQNFAYRVDMSWWIFVLADGLALLIALMTVSTQAIRAALANPVQSLRYE